MRNNACARTEVPWHVQILTPVSSLIVDLKFYSRNGALGFRGFDEACADESPCQLQKRLPMTRDYRCKGSRKSGGAGVSKRIVFANAYRFCGKGYTCYLLCEEEFLSTGET